MSGSGHSSPQHSQKSQQVTVKSAFLASLEDVPTYAELRDLENSLTLHPDPKNLTNIVKLHSLYSVRISVLENDKHKIPTDQQFRAVLERAGQLEEPYAERVRADVRSMHDTRRRGLAEIARLKDRKERLVKVLQVPPNRPGEFRAQMRDIIPSFWANNISPHTAFVLARPSSSAPATRVHQK